MTFAISTRAKELKADGHHVIAFGVGEPDFDTPEHIKAAAAEALARPGAVAGYTPVAGTPALREAAAEDLRISGVAAEAGRVIVSCGAKHSLFNAMAVLLDDDDEAIIPAPYWVSYPSMALAAGGRPVYVDTRPDGCVLTPERLAAALTPRTRVLVFCSPGNPTGVTHTRAQMAALGEVLAQYPDVTVVSDEIYQHLVYDETEFVPFAVACPALADRTVTVRGCSKTFAMTGWRVGFAAGPADVIGAMTRYQSHSTSNPPAIAQVAAIAALTGPMEPVYAMREAFDMRRRLMVERLNAIDGCELYPPTGAFYCFPDLAARLGGETPLSFCTRLLDEQKVACVPGEAFGAPTNIRFSYATSEADIEEGCARFARFLG